MFLSFYKEPDKGVVINLEVAIATDTNRSRHTLIKAWAKHLSRVLKVSVENFEEMK